MKGYLEFNVMLYTYQFTEDGQTSIDGRAIGLHYCNQEDRGNFYDQTDHQTDLFATFGSFYTKILCLDNLSDLDLYGNLASLLGRYIKVELSRCSN